MESNDPAIQGIHAGRFGEADAPFKRGRVALRWHEIDEVAADPATREACKDRVRATSPRAKPGAIPVATGQLLRFVHEATVRDLVIWRSQSARAIHLARITGAYRYDAAESAACPHQRAASWLHAVQPNLVPQGALYEPGASMSWFSGQNYADEWRAFIGGNHSPNPSLATTRRTKRSRRLPRASSRPHATSS